MNERDNYWFTAKRFGIGWTWPAGWQGWTTVAVYALLLVVGLLMLPNPTARTAWIIVLTIALIGIVIWKGERPVAWRSGRD